jgi:hypothetical protein
VASWWSWLGLGLALAGVNVAGDRDGGAVVLQRLPAAASPPASASSYPGPQRGHKPHKPRHASKSSSSAATALEQHKRRL